MIYTITILFIRNVVFRQAQNFLIEKTLIKEKKHKRHSYLYIIHHKTHKQSFKFNADSDEVVKITPGSERKLSLVVF